MISRIFGRSWAQAEELHKLTNVTTNSIFVVEITLSIALIIFFDLDFRLREEYMTTLLISFLLNCG